MRPVARIVVGVSGASGAAIALRILDRLAAHGTVETHLVVTTSGERTVTHELGPTGMKQLTERATKTYSIDDIGATIASGSFHTDGMVVAPCSMHTLGAIAHSMSDNLLIRAADVHLKERRKLILIARESPLHLGHLKSMIAITEMGGVIAPPAPAFYLLPQSVSDVVDQIAARAIDHLGLALPAQSLAWNGD